LKKEFDRFVGRRVLAIKQTMGFRVSFDLPIYSKKDNFSGREDEVGEGLAEGFGGEPRTLEKIVPYH
jgi:hypothetical protein